MRNRCGIAQEAFPSVCGIFVFRNEINFVHDRFIRTSDGSNDIEFVCIRLPIIGVPSLIIVRQNPITDAFPDLERSPIGTAPECPGLKALGKSPPVAPDAPLLTFGSVMEPLGQSAIRLMPDPKPCCFDHRNPGQPIAGLGDSSVRLFLRDVKTSMAGSLRPSVHTTRRARLRGSAWRYRGG